MTDQPKKEFRFKRGSIILDYIKHFSATEKVIFGFFAILALITAIIMADMVNQHYMVKVPAYGGNLTEGMLGLPHAINPVLAVSDADKDISSLVYSGLTKYNGNDLVADVAESYSISADGLTYDFKLKPNLHFQDGTPMNADDVAFTIQKIQDPALKSPKQADWADATIKEVSPLEIQFVLKQPYSPFLANTTVGIIPKHIWQNVSDDQFIYSQYNMSSIGSGPYKISSIVHDSGGIPVEYDLSTWNGYYGEKPHISSISFKFFQDEASALSALDSGSIDSLASIPPSAAEALASNSAQSYTVISAPLPRVFGLFLNQNNNPVLADKSVRQALDMSVDRTAIVNSVLDGYGTAIQGPLPLGMSTSTDANDHPDISGAQAILAKDGWKKNTDGVYEKKSGKSASTTLSISIYTADTPDLKRAADMVKDEWTAIGVQVDVRVFEESDLYQNVIRPRKYDALLFGELVGKDRDVYAFWHSSQRNAPGLNVAMYANSNVDALLDKMRSSSDDAVRNAAYGQLDQDIRADVPAVFLYVPNFIYAVPKTLQGLNIRGMTVPSDRFNSINNEYIETQNVWRMFVKN